MPAVTIDTRIEVVLGGETKLINHKRVHTTTGKAFFDQSFTVLDNNTSVTLFDIANSPLTALELIVVDVDPDNVYADAATAAQLTIEIAGATDKISLRVRRETPLVLGADEIGSDKDNLDEVIKTIKAKNENAQDAGDVAVRVFLIGS